MIIRVKRRGKMLYFYFNYKKKEIYYTTGIRISDKNWDSKKQKIDQKIVQLYEPRLTDLEAKIRKAIVKLEFNNKEVSLASLREEIEGIPAKKRAVKKMLIPTFEKYLERKSQRVD